MPPGGVPAHRTRIALATALAAVVFPSLWFTGSYFAIAAGILGAVLVVAAASALLLGARPTAAAWLTGASLAALALWAVASVSWGGLPHTAWRFAGLALVGVAAVLLGSAVGLRGLREPALAGVGIGLAAHAAVVLAVVGSGSAPRDWFSGRQLEGTIGYHNALGPAAAMGIPLALWFASSSTRSVRGLSGAGSVVLLATALLTQSRATLGALALALVVQSTLARRGRVVATTVLLLAVGVVLFDQLRGVDEALVDAELARAEPDAGPLARYALVAAICALAVGAAAVLRVPARLSGPRLRYAVVAVAAVVTVAAVAASAAVLASRADDLLDRLKAEPNSPSQVTGGETRLSSISPTGRVEQWRLALKMAGEAPLVGHGIGSFAERWGLERTKDNLYVLQPHSLELEQLAELGALGAALLAMFLAGILWLLVRGVRDDRALGAAATAAVVAFLAPASVDWIFSFPSLLAVALLVAGAAGGRGRGGQAHAVACIAATVAALAVLAGPALGSWYLDRARAAEMRSLDDAWRIAARARTFSRWDPEIVSYQGRIAEGQGRFRHAAVLYDRAADLAPQPWTDRFREGRALRRAGLVGASRAACRQAAMSNPLERELRRGVCDDGS